MNKDNKKVMDSVVLALAEDIGDGDVSASLLDDKTLSAQIIARESAVICGTEYAQIAFLLLNDGIQIEWKKRDGDRIAKDEVLCLLSGSANSIISAERVALNFLQTLSAVATQTKYLVDKIAHTNAQLLDTRKTIPGLRLAQKYAVQCGGGINHRIGLYDAVMLKENHIIAAGSISKAVKKAVKKYPNLPLIVEVETLQQLAETLELTGITRVLCDNFSTTNLVKAVNLAKNKLPLEASGNIDKHNIIEVANTGVDTISIGSITKNVQAIDFSLRFTD
ncbi:Quinolinate phosphoribosyltransferase [decarboxylating] [uncultured Candidatus Thioglobus sp.]|nr:Quinolinate phosphoribosyltransferase [decarboxylating] [uncultured Candidatus Thioglobus sp.]